MESLEAKAAVDRKVKPKADVGRPVRHDGRAVHLASLIDFCTKLSLRSISKSTKEESSFQETTARTTTDTEQYSQSKAHQLPSWQQQDFRI